MWIFRKIKSITNATWILLNREAKVSDIKIVRDKLSELSHKTFRVSIRKITHMLGIIFPGPSDDIDITVKDINANMYISKMKRDILSWQSMCIIATIVAILALLGYKKNYSIMTKHIARIKIDNVISEETFASNEFLDNVIAKLGNDNNVGGVIVQITSGGGSASGSEALYNALRRLSKKKKLIAVVKGVAASGAYLAAIGCDTIIAQNTSIVGSIGVFNMNYNVSKLVKKLGVDVEIYKSSKFKASPNPYETTDQEVAANSQKHVMEIFQWFRDLVQERRKLSVKETQRVANAKIFIGMQALSYKLIDSIGDENDALEIFKKEGLVGEDAKIIDDQYDLKDNHKFPYKSAISTVIGNFFTILKNSIIDHSRKNNDIVMMSN